MLLTYLVLGLTLPSLSLIRTGGEEPLLVVSLGTNAASIPLHRGPPFLRRLSRLQGQLMRTST